MAVKVRKFGLQKRKPIWIETPEGIIKMEWVSAKRLEVDIPSSMAFAKGDPAKLDLRFLASTTNGDVKPTYKFLVPQLDDEGNLLKLSAPTVLKLGS